MRRSIAGLVVFVAAYAISVWLYVDSGMGRPDQISDSSPSAGGTKVTVDVQEIKPTEGLLIANMTVTPGPALLDQAGNLKDDLSLVATSLVLSTKHTWPKGALPDVFRAQINLTGEVAKWPFDTYQSGPINVQLFSGSSSLPEHAEVSLVERLLGWHVDGGRIDKADAHSAYRLDLRRSLSTAAFAVLILGVLIALAALALFVAVQTMRDRRKFQPPMTTWYAAMLFAVVPLRNALPDPPPFGSWMDVTIVLWVIVVLAISLVLYIACWWRHTAPDFDQAAKSAESLPK